MRDVNVCVCLLCGEWRMVPVCVRPENRDLCSLLWNKRLLTTGVIIFVTVKVLY